MNNSKKDISKILHFECCDQSVEPLFLHICQKQYNGKIPNSWIKFFKVRNELYRIPIEGKGMYVLKSFRAPSIIKAFYYKFIGKSKAYRAYHNTLSLNNISQYAPSAIGYLIYNGYHGIGIGKSYFLSENLDGFEEIRDYMNGKANVYEILNPLLKFIIDLHKKGILHKDLSPGNIMFKKENGDYIFRIVDVNRLECKREEISEKIAQKNLSRISDNYHIAYILFRSYAKMRGFDEEQFLTKANKYADKYFLPKAYKWSIKRHCKEGYPRGVFIWQLIKFRTSILLRSFLNDKSSIFSRLKERERAFYFGHLSMHDVRKVILRKEKYKEYI